MIGFYGGSFNPIHRGHIEVANFLLLSPYIDRVCFTPVFKHPFNKSLVDFNHRVEMIKLAIQGNEKLCVSEAEREKGGVSYTFELLDYLKERFGKDFFFIGGLDTLNSIDKWKNWDYIVSNFNILFTTRAGFEVDKKRVEEVEGVSGKRLNIVKDIRKLNPDGLNLIEVPFIPVSSSRVREMIKNGKDLSGLLHPDVISFIYKKKLYGSD